MLLKVKKKSVEVGWWLVGQTGRDAFLRCPLRKGHKKELSL